MLQTAMITHENKSAIQAFTRPGTCSSIISTGEDVARDTYAPVLDEQQFVDHDADLQGDFEERAGGHSSLGRWSLLTRHGRLVALGMPNGDLFAKSLAVWMWFKAAASNLRTLDTLREIQTRNQWNWK